MADLTARLFRLVDELQGRGRTTVGALAERLGVSERTVRRDLVRLVELDVGVVATPGRSGGVELPPGSLLAPLRFTDAELVALHLGVRSVERLGDAALAKAAARARERLEGVLTPQARAHARALDDATIAGPGRRAMASADPQPTDAALLIVLAEAIRDRARVVLRYAAAGARETTRAVDGYGLVHLSRWYLAAYCHLRRDLRTFRLDRIRGVARDGARFERTPGVDPFALVASSIAMAPVPGTVVCEVVLATDLETAARHVPATAVVLEPDPEGVRLTTRSHPDGLARIALHLLWLPWPMRVVGPDALRQALDAVATRARAVARS